MFSAFGSSLFRSCSLLIFSITLSQVFGGGPVTHQPRQSFVVTNDGSIQPFCENGLCADDALRAEGFVGLTDTSEDLVPVPSLSQKVVPSSPGLRGRRRW